MFIKALRDYLAVCTIYYGKKTRLITGDYVIESLDKVHDEICVSNKTLQYMHWHGQGKK